MTGVQTCALPICLVDCRPVGLGIDPLELLDDLIGLFLLCGSHISTESNKGWASFWCTLSLGQIAPVADIAA